MWGQPVQENIRIVENDFAEYEPGRNIGQGSFGKVFLIRRPSDRQQFVMKQMDLGRMSPEDIACCEMEAKILAAVQHDNIVKFIDVYKTRRNFLCLVMEYADGKTLSKKLTLE